MKHRPTLLGSLAALSLISGIALSASPNRPHPAAVAIKALAITESGRSEHNDDYAVSLCKRFEPGEAQVRTFIEKAREVDTRVHTHDRYSPCYAAGTVEFEDGTTGEWRIHSGGTGILRMDKGPAKTLRCRACRWVDPFAGAYGAR